MPPQKRKLQIELDESVAVRLDKLAENSSRYSEGAEVAAEVVRLYLSMLEAVEEHMAGFKHRQRLREGRKVKRRQGSKPLQAGKRRTPLRTIQTTQSPG